MNPYSKVDVTSPNRVSVPTVQQIVAFKASSAGMSKQGGVFLGRGVELDSRLCVNVRSFEGRGSSWRVLEGYLRVFGGCARGDFGA